MDPEQLFKPIQITVNSNAKLINPSALSIKFKFKDCLT